MKIKSLVIMTILLTSTIWSQAQQINPVPDYVFRNQMSVGRNAVTDTAAYFSIGPRYGATKGFMPPIVGDTATFSSGKRNGLLIFSVQKNKFLYWDSVRVQWSDMAGSSGAYIVAGDTAAMLAPYLRKSDTASMLSPYYRSATASAALALKLNISDTSTMLGNYIRHAGFGLTKSGQSFLVDTLNIATRAWRQKGLDSLAALEVSGSGTTNYVPKFTAGSTIGNSQIFDNGTSVGIGTSSPLALLHINGSSATAVQSYIRNANGSTNSASELVFGTWSGAIPTGSGNPGPSAKISAINVNSANASTDLTFTTYNGGGTPGSAERLRITSGGNVGINDANPTDMLVVNGRMRVNGTNRITFGNSSGGYAGIGVTGATTGNLTFNTFDGTSDAERLRIFANGRVFIGASPTDAGYQLDINGTLRSVNGANFATTSGNVGIGTASPSGKLDVQDALVSDYASIVRLRNSNAGTTNTNLAIEFWDRSTSINAAVIGTRSNIAGNWGGDIVFKNQQNGSPQTTTTSLTEVMKLDGANQRISLSPAGTELFRFASSGEAYINTTSDAGDYKLQVSGNIYNTGSAVLAATSGNVGVGVTPSAWSLGKAVEVKSEGNSIWSYDIENMFVTNNAYFNGGWKYGKNGKAATYTQFQGQHFWDIAGTGTAGNAITFTTAMAINGAGETLINTTTDAGDYKLQVEGNARVGTGKLDIASNTTFGIGVARSGTSEVAGQIYNSSGILYFGAESSAGGQIFSGSSAYAGVIGTGANYPLQFAVNNITRGGFSTSGNLLLGFTTDSYFLKLQVNGSIFSNNQFFGQGANAQLSIDSSTNISPIYVSNQSLTGTSAQGMMYSSTTWNTTGNPSLLDLNITNTASGATSNYIKITDGTNTFRVTKAAEVVTAAPSGGSIKPWKLGEAATVSPTSPNRTIRVEIDGTVYYLHAKTTND